MILVIVTALLAVCGAAKLDRGYLPPLSAKTAGGSPGSLLAPIEKSGLPTGSYVNHNQGVVVDAVAPGTRASGVEPSGLGAPRASYGSTDSKVGDAAFRGSLTGFGKIGVPSTATPIAPGFGSNLGAKENAGGFIRVAPGFGSIGGAKENAGGSIDIAPGFDFVGGAKENAGGSIRIAPGFGSIAGANENAEGSIRIAPGFGSIGGANENAEGSIRIAPGFGSIVATKASEDDKSRASTLKFANEISKENYSYGFQTDNGISVGENGVAGDGIKANGEYSYKGDDGKLYSVSYTAGKDGYKPQGSHLPTPPPIPKEIVKSLEDNAKDEAQGIIDDGSYDAQKYNGEDDYSSNNDDNKNNKPSTNAGVTASNSFVSQSKQEYFGTKSSFGFLNTGSQGLNTGAHFLPHTTSNRFGIGAQKTDNSNFGASSASATASTSGDVNNQQSLNLESNLGRSPVSYAGNTAYSSATATGSGIASAFASTSPNLPNYKKEYLPPNFGTIDQFVQDTKFGTEISKSSEYSSVHPATGLPSVITPTKLPILELNTPFEPNKTPVVSNTLNAGSNAFDSNAIGSLSSNSQSSHSSLLPQKSPLDSNAQIATGEHTPQSLETLNSNDASFEASLTKVSLNQKQGSDSSYYYNQPTKIFTTPVSKFQDTKVPLKQTTGSLSTFPISSTQQASNSYNTLKPSSVIPTVSSVSGQYSSLTSSSNYNGITQASISGFPAVASTPSAQFESQPSQFGLKPSEKFSQLISSQQSEGTLYEYPKPSASITTNKETSQSENQLTSQFGQKPLGSQSVTGSFQSTQLGLSTTSKFGQNTGIKGQSAQQTTNLSQKPFGSSPTKNFGSSQSTFGSQYGSQPSINVGTGSSVAPELESTYQLGQKPLGSQSITGTYQSTQLSSSTTSKFGQNTGTKGQFAQQTTNLSQKPFGSSPTKNLGSSQSTFGSQYGSQPSINVGTGSSVAPELESTYQLGQKPLGSQSITGTYQSTQLSSSTTSKFGQNPSIKGQSAQQTTNLNQKPFGSSQVTNFGSSQSTFGSQYGSKPTIGAGTGSSVVPATESTYQLGQKPLGSQSLTGSFQSTQLGSSSTSKFGQTTGIKGQFAQQTTNLNQKPFGSSQITNFGSSQSTFGSQYGSKPTINAGTGSSVAPATEATYQFGQKPLGSQSLTGSFQSTQLGSSTTSKFGQNTGIKGQTAQQTTNLNQKPFGSSQITNFGSSQSTFGSQHGSKPIIGEGTGSSVVPATESTYQLGQKPLGSQSLTGSFQSTQLGSSSTSKFGQTTGIKGQFAQQTTNLNQKPFGSSQITNFGSSQSAFGSQYGSKPTIGEGTGSSVVPATESTYQLGQKPLGSQSLTGSFQSTQLGSSSTSKFGQTTGIKGQFAQQTTNLNQKPFGSSQITNFGSSQSTFGSQYGSKPTINAGTGSSVAPATEATYQFGQKPLGSQSLTGSFQSTQLGSSTTSKFGQNTGIKGQTAQQTTNLNQKPFGSSQITNFGSSQSTFGSQHGSKPIIGEGTGSSVVPATESTYQLGQKPLGSQSLTGSFQSTQLGSSSTSKFGQTTGIKGQFAQQTTNLNQKPFGSSQITNFGSSQSTFGSQYGSKPTINAGTGSSVAPATEATYQFGQKPLGSQSLTGSFQSTQLGSSTTSKFGQNTGIKGQTAQQTTNLNQKPFGSSQITNFGSSQSTFGSQHGSKPTIGVGTGSSVVPATESTYQLGQKPLGSQSLTGSFQSTQLGSSSTSKFGQTTGIKGQFAQQTTNLNQKPFGSSQITSFGSSQSAFGSQYGSKPTIGEGTGSSVVPATESTYQLGQKPLGSQSLTGSFQSTQLGSSSTSKFGQTTGIKGQFAQQTTNLNQKPFGSSQITNFGSSQTAFGSQYGSKPTIGEGTGSSVVPATESTYQLGQKPLGSQSLTGSFQSTQLGSSSTSKFGQTTGIKGQFAQQTTNLNQKPFGSSQITNFGSSQTAFGSQYGSKPTIGEGTGSSVVPATESTYQLGQKPLGSQSLTGSFHSTQLGSSSTSRFGQTTGNKGQFAQQTTNLNQKPFGSSQITNFGSSQSTFGSQYGSKPTISAGTGSSVVPATESTYQLGQKPLGSQSITGSFQSTQLGSSTITKFGQTTGIKGQSAQQTTNLSQKPFGSSQTTNFGSSQSTFGSQYGSQPSINAGTDSSVAPELESTYQLGQKPLGSHSVTGTFHSTQLGSSTTSKLGQNTGIKGQSAQETTLLNQKPFGSSQITNSGSSQSTFGSQYGSKPTISAGTGISVVPATESTYQLGQKPLGSQSLTGSFQSTQLGSSSTSKFGQTIDTKGQSAQQTIHLSQKPFSSSQTTNFGSSQSTFGSQYGSKPTVGAGTGSSVVPATESTYELGQKPLGSQLLTGSFQSTQLGSSSTSKFGQTTGIKGQLAQQTTNLNQKPFGSSQITNFGSSHSTFGSQYGSKPTINAGTGSSVTPVPESTYQLGQKPLGSQSLTGSFQSTQLGSSSTSKFDQTTGIKGQSAQQTTNLNQKPFGSPQITNFGSSQSTFGSQYGSKPIIGAGTGSSVVPATESTYQLEQKPLGSQSLTGSFQSTQLGSSSSSKFGQTTGIKGQSAQQTTNLNQKPFGSPQITNFGSSQSTFGSQYGSKPTIGAGTGSSVVPATESTYQLEQKPLGSQSLTGSFQSTQLGSSSSSKFGQTTGIKGQSAQQTTNLNQKPFGSSQITNFGSSQSTFGSQYGSKPTIGAGTGSSVVPGTESTYQLGQKPLGSQSLTGSFQSTQLGSSSTSKFGQTIDTKGQSAQQTIHLSQKPFSSSQTTNFGSSQSTFGSQYGSKPTIGAGTGSSVVPATESTYQLEQKPLGSQSLTGSFQSTQLGSSSSSKFGQTTGIKGQSAQQTTNLNQKPFGSSQITNFGSSQSTFGSQYGSKPTIGAGTGSSVVPGTVSTYQLGQKPLGSQSLTGSFQSTQLGSSTTSKFGQNTGNKEYSADSVSAVEPSPQFEQNPIEFQFTKESFQTTQISSSIKPEFMENTSIKGQSPQQTSNFGQKPFGSLQTGIFGTSQSPLGAIQSTQISDKSDTLSQVDQLFDKKPYISSQVSSSNFQHKSPDFAISHTPASTSSSTSAGFSQYHYHGTQDKPFVNTQIYFPSQIDFKNEQIPKSTATAFVSNLGSFGDTKKLGTQTYQHLDSSLSKPTYTGFGTEDSSLQFGGEAFKAFKNFPSLEGFGKGQPLLSSTQFTGQPLLPTATFSSKSLGTPSTQVSFKQAQSNVLVPTISESSSQNSFDQPLKPNSFGSSKVGLVQDSSQLGSTVSTTQTSALSVNNNVKFDKNVIGNKEVFGGPRDPPKFDIETGYHY